MIEANHRFVKLGVLVATVALAVVAPGNTAATVVALLFVYALWLATVSIVVTRSRYVGGLVLLVLSFFPLAAGLIADWIGVVGLALVAQGTALAMTGAARLDY